MDLVIRKMEYEDIPMICTADQDTSDSFKEYLKNHLQNQDLGECSTLIAIYKGKIAGHLFLYHKCR